VRANSFGQIKSSGKISAIQILALRLQFFVFKLFPGILREQNLNDKHFTMGNGVSSVFFNADYEYRACLAPNFNK
jgi:hypothetical protein